MGPVSNGIESVRAFELPSGIRADGMCTPTPGTALVKWRSSSQNLFYQIYVNGRFAGTTLDSEQRQMVVPVPCSLESPVHIEVVGVEAEQVNADFSTELEQPQADSGRVQMILLRSQSLPVGATAEIYFDNGTGQVDYDNPLTDSPIQIWPAWQDKAGFAMSGFGLGDFGYDSAAAVGFGRGSFAKGQFGLDADTVEWISPPLQSGTYKFGVKITDKSGNQSSAGETEPITVIPAARPADELSLMSFDRQTNQLLLEIIEN
ncbi:MAG: hypothetical protein ACYSWO_00710 [Planctomycetota bacterium]|jgi:hypothetical protein